MIFHHASVAFSFASLRRTSSMLRSQTQSVSISHRLLSASSLFGRGPTKKAPGPVRHDFSKYEDDDTSVDISIKGLDRLAKEHFGSTDASRQRARKEIVVKPVKERVKASAKKDWNNSPVMAVFHKPVGVQSTMKDEWGRESLGKLLHNWPFGKSMHPVGRLDADSSGLLLFSSDGDITQALLSPRTQVDREYVATVVGIVDEERLRGVLQQGVETSEGVFTASLLSSQILDGDALKMALELVRSTQLERYNKMVQKSAAGTSADSTTVILPSENIVAKKEQAPKAKITLSGIDPPLIQSTKPPSSVSTTSSSADLSSFDAFLISQGLTTASTVRLVVREGKYRMVRRILHNAGHSVVALHRTRYGEVSLGELPENELRPIYPDELHWAREATTKYRKVVRAEGKSESKNPKYRK